MNKNLYEMLEKYDWKNNVDEEHQNFYIRLTASFQEAENAWATLSDLAHIIQKPDEEDNKDVVEAAIKDLDTVCNNLADLAMSLYLMKNEYWKETR